ncbi:MAG: sigma factor [Acetobacter okinawensis]|uniref:sigma factor n=1 Tax=Acetobacter okinawensis TaxID=1076594 RepID=UPI0039EA0CDA
MTSWSTLLTTLFRSEQRKVEALARRKCTDPEQAADVMQDAFMGLSRLAEPDAVNNPGRLLFTTALAFCPR